jgi:hypothetical protein
MQQTIHDELNATLGRTFVTSQGQPNAVPTVSETTVNRNYFTLRSYSYAQLYGKVYSFWQSFLSRQICLLGSRDMAIFELITTANVPILKKTHVWIVPGLQKYSKNPDVTYKSKAPQGWQKSSSILRTQTLRDIEKNSFAVTILVPGFVRPCCRG